MSDGVGEVSRGIVVTVEDVYQRISDLVSGKMDSQDSGDIRVVGPWHEVYTCSLCNNNCVTAVCSDLFDHLIALAA